MLLLKVVIELSFIVVLLRLISTALYGRLIRKDRDRGIRIGSSAIAIHKQHANRTLYATGAAIILTELFVRLSGGAHYHSVFFWVHLFGFAVPFSVTLLILRYAITGQVSRVKHKYLAYACLILYVCTFTTGTVLLWRP